MRCVDLSAGLRWYGQNDSVWSGVGHDHPADMMQNSSAVQCAVGHSQLIRDVWGFGVAGLPAARHPSGWYVVARLDSSVCGARQSGMSGGWIVRVWRWLPLSGGGRSLSGGGGVSEATDFLMTGGSTDGYRSEYVHHSQGGRGL